MSIAKQAFSQSLLKRLICAVKNNNFRTNHTFHAKIVVKIFIVCYTTLVKIGLSKEVVLEVLNLLPFGGVAKTAFDFLLKSIEGI